MKRKPFCWTKMTKYQEKTLTCNQIGDHHRNRPMSNRCAIDVVVNCANNHMLRVDHRDKHVLQTTQLLQRPLHAQMPFRVNLQIMKNRNEWERKKKKMHATNKRIFNMHINWTATRQMHLIWMHRNRFAKGIYISYFLSNYANLWMFPALHFCRCIQLKKKIRYFYWILSCQFGFHS